MTKSGIKHLNRLVGETIAKRRLKCRLTQEQLAEQLGIGVEAVSRIERGLVLPTVMRLSELADIFQCNIADLVTEVSSRPKDQANRIEYLLARLTHEDRLIVLDIVEKLAVRFEHSD